MAEVKTISTEELDRRLREGSGLEFWNVLTDDYFKGELIPGSRRVPLDSLGREVHAANLPKDAEVVVYCAGPQCPQSRMAAEKLQALGYTNVRAYEGGIEAWKAEGRVVESINEPVAA